MVVQHNLKAMNANRMLNVNTKASAGSTEKLSSGYRVNRAADDAAGLAISEKMRKQIRGLTQASRNAEDGISCVQTGEGALAEVQNMLQRMNELCVQAANGTNSITDRQYIQDELDQLVTEIDRISETTKFNELYLLKGDTDKPTSLVYTFKYINDDEIDTTGVSNIKSEKYPDIPQYKPNAVGTEYGPKSTTSSIPAKGTYMNDKDEIVKYDGTTPVTSTITLRALTVYGPNSSASISAGKYMDDTGKIVEYDVKTKATSTIALMPMVQSGKIEINVKVKYNGSENVYMAPTSIMTSDASNPKTADIIKNGDDFTKYMNGGLVKMNGTVTATKMAAAANTAGTTTTSTTAGATNVNTAGVTTTSGAAGSTNTTVVNTKSYIAFKNTDIDNSTKTSSGITEDSSNKALTSTRDAYIYEARTKNIIRVPAKAALNNYITTNDGGQYVMKEGFALLAEATEDSQALKEPTLGKAIAGGTDKRTLAYSDFVGAKADHTVYDADRNPVIGMALYKYFDEDGNYKGGLFRDDKATLKIEEGTDPLKDSKDPTKIDFYASKLPEKITAALTFSLHTGADSALNNRILTTVETMSAKGLGIHKLSSAYIGIVDATGDNAREAIDVVAEALKIVSTQRSTLGAVQNRLEHTISNLDNVVENTTAAESAIRDTDMADEMVRFSNNQVLLQAGQSILAQANQANQGVLSLLQ